MKKITPHVILLFLVLFACTKEATVITSFDFTASVENDSIATINVMQPTKLIIDQERVADTQKFSFKYALREGDGVFMASDSIAVLPTNEWIALEGNEVDLGYLAATVGDHLIDGTIKDEDGREQPLTIRYTVRHSDLQVSATSSMNTLDFQTPVPVTLLIESNSPDSTLTYKITYSFPESEGVLYPALEDGTANMEEPIPLGQSSDIEKGEYDFVALMDGTGATMLQFVVEDNNGNKVTETIDFSIQKEEFEISVRMSPDGVTFGEPAKAIITVTAPNHVETVEYELMYEFLEGSLVFLDGNGNPVPQETMISIPVGVTEWDISTDSPEDVQVRFFGQNNTDFSDEAEETFQFGQEEFELTARISPSPITVGEESTITLTFDVPEHSEAVSYEALFRFEEGTATVKDLDGTTLNANEYYPAVVGTNEWKVTGVEPGVPNIEFVGRNSTNFTDNASDSFEVKQKDYTLGVTSNEQGGFTGESVIIRGEIEEIGIGGDGYTLSFQNGASVGTLFYNGNTYNPGDEFLVPVGTFEMVYTGTSDGDHNLVFNGLSTSNVPKQATISFKFEKYVEPFTLSVTQANGRKLSGEPFNIAVTANATNGHDPNTDYFLSFGFNGTDRGSIVFQGVTYTEGQPIPIPHGFSNLSFTANDDMDFPIVWTGTNSTDEEEQQNMQVDMYPRPKISGVLTWFFADNKRSCGNGCNWDYHGLVKMDVTVDPSASADIFRIRVRNNRPGHPTQGQFVTYTASFTSGRKRDGFHEFYFDTFVPTGTSEWYDGESYTLTVVDSNGVEGVIEGIFTNDKNDGQ
ncbi:MAG: hypothetical protein AAF554_18515 [Bacteroidota bacterium]